MRFMTLFAIVASLVSLAAEAQDVVIVIEDAAGVARPAPTNGSLPAPPQVVLEVPDEYPRVQAPRMQPANANRLSASIRIEELRRQRPGIGGPISMIATGFIAAGASAWMSALYSWIGCWDCGGTNGGTVGFAVLASAAFVLGVAGVVKLIRRIRQRRRSNRSIRALEAQFEF